MKSSPSLKQTNHLTQTSYVKSRLNSVQLQFMNKAEIEKAVKRMEKSNARMAESKSPVFETTPVQDQRRSKSTT